MTPEQYARAKEMFFSLMDEDKATRESRLIQLHSTDPTIAGEVRSLLEMHFSKTIVVPTVEMNNTTIHNRSRPYFRLSQLTSRLVGGTIPLAISLAAIGLIAMIGWWLQTELADHERIEYNAFLKSTTLQKAERLRMWARGYQIRMRDWGKLPAIRNLVAELCTEIQDVPDYETRNKILIESAQQEKIRLFIESLTNDESEILGNDEERSPIEMKYAIWNDSSVLIADWQYRTDLESVGMNSTPEGASILNRVFFDTTVFTVLPEAGFHTITKGYKIETNEQMVMFFVPIFDPADDSKVIGAMMLRSGLFREELQSIVNEDFLGGSNCYLLDKQCSIITKAKALEVVRDLPPFEENKIVRGRKVIHSLDPGGNLLRGYQPEGNVAEWPKTKSAANVCEFKNGSDVYGYRDYRGINVVGAWQWLPFLNTGLVVEIERSNAFASQVFVERAFRIIWGIPLSVSLILIALSIRRIFRDHSMTNRQLGSYVVREKIGEGGLGIVYRAEHRMLARPAALKLLKQSHTSPDEIKRFEREVRIAARLTHQNTVSIYDFGLSRDGLYYCAMELVDGANLANFMSFDPTISIDRLIWIMRQIGGALAEAHDLGLVHRDIKPQNVMICHFGQFTDHVKVVDFGLAKDFSESSDTNRAATRVVMGTPGFIAPERLDSPSIADPRIDIFSLGVLMAYMVTDKVPALGCTYGSLYDLASTGRFAHLLHDLPFEKLLKLISGCIAVETSQRLASMDLVNDQLESISVAYPWDRTAAGQWWKDNGLRLLAFASGD